MKSINVDFNNDNMISTFTSEQFYDSWDVFLRELLQNAYDACYTRQALEWSWGTEFLEIEEAEKVASIRRGFSPRVVVSYNSENGMLFVEDNGIGINARDLEKYVASIGSSFYTSEAYANQRLKYEPISQFGIGLCSCFRVSRAILIESKKDRSINTAWNVMDQEDLEPIAAKWFGNSGNIEYIHSNRKLVGTRVTVALLPKYAMNLTLSTLVQSIQKYMIYQPIPIDIFYDRKKVLLNQSQIPSSPTSYVAGVTTLQIDNELLEGYITLFNPKHAEMVAPSELFQQGFRICDHADEVGLKPEWIRNMSYRLNVKKRCLALKMTRDGVAEDENLRQLREMIGRLILGYYQNNPIGLAQYLSDGRNNVLSEYEQEMSVVMKALFVKVYIKGQEVELTVDTIINGFMGQDIRIAFMKQELFDFYRRQYPEEYQSFLERYNLICFEKNREFFTQFMAPYTKAYRYMVTELPGITYMEMVADLHMRKSISPYRKNYQAYPNPAVDERIFCFVCNEQSGPFHITLNRNHRNVKLLAEASEYPKVNNLREVIIENIKQRIINSQNHWDKIIDFGGSFVDEWKSDSPMSVQAIWCLERDFAESINRFIALKLSEEERREMGLLGLKFVEEDFQAWWYMPRTR